MTTKTKAPTEARTVGDANLNGEEGEAGAWGETSEGRRQP